MNHVRKIASYILLCLCMNANAEETQSTSNDTKGPERFVRETSDKVMSIVKSDKSDATKSSELTEVFLGAVDIDFMGKFALGQHWQELNDNARLSYLETYKKFMIASYIPKFRKYSGQKFELKGIKPMDNDQYLVQTDIKADGPNSAPYNVDYRVKLETSGYKVRDIIAEGVSVITTQRSDFGSIISNGGIDSLNRELNTKAEKGSSPAKS